MDSINNLKRRLEAKLPPDVMELLRDETLRLEKLPLESPDYLSLKIYLEWVALLPWSEQSPDQLDPIAFHQSLSMKHIGREELKQRISEHIAVANFKKSLKGLTFCFVGPPGVGKTNLARSTAQALGRKCIELRLSELETETSYRGRRREDSYETPGKILQEMKRLGTKNPVIVLKGMDRPGTRWSIDPVNAVLQLIDPQYNQAFLDHYLGFGFDLSQVLFIFTAKTLDNVPHVVRDRMEIFHLSGYAPEEKLRIAKLKILPAQIRGAGLSTQQVEMSDDSILLLINRYTREAGVYYLESLLRRLCYNSAYLLATKSLKKVEIDEEMITKVFGPQQFYPQLRENRVRPGVATGLVWTPLGGDIIFVEVAIVPGKGRVLVTGQIGEVMKESADIAISLARSEAQRFGFKINFGQKDFHIHVPFGSIQKDGPSAGSTILTAIFSWLAKVSVDPTLAMTGEITLRGSVARVGGVKEKVIAAHRAGIRKVVMPLLNRQDLIEVPEEVRNELEFQFVESVDEILKSVVGLKEKGDSDESE